MFVISILLALIVIAVLSIHWYQTRSYAAVLLNSFPGPETIPIVGNMLHYSTKPEILFLQLRERIKKFNQTFRIWHVYYPVLYVVTADDAEIILSSAKLIDKSVIYELLEPWLGTGLLTSTGSKWQHRRKILTPAFHFNILRRFVTVFGEHCEKLVQQLKDESKKSKTDIVPLMNKFTLATICETAMGTKTDDRDKTQKEYFSALHNQAPILIKRILMPWLTFKLIFDLSYLSWVQKKYIRILHNFTESVIKERELNFKNEDVENLEENDENMFVGKKRLAMLDLLISVKRNEKAINNEGIREEVDTFMFEVYCQTVHEDKIKNTLDYIRVKGHDTTSVAISYILLALANHQLCQEKIIVELHDIFGDSKRPASFEDLQQMKYTEMCIKECLRLYPSVPLISRQLSEDTLLTHHTAPAGTTVVIHIYDIHRDSKYFPDPERFDPNRFLAENCKDRNPYAFIPFSAGPRNCIGQRFAMFELKSIVSCILRNFRMEPITRPSDLTWLADLVLRTSSPINIKFAKRSS